MSIWVQLGENDHASAAVDVPEPSVATSQATTPARLGCEYSSGGVCCIQGRGAVLKWKPSGGGMSGAKYRRYYYYICDFGPKDGKKLRQTRLSFEPVSKKKSEDDPRRNEDNTN